MKNNSTGQELILGKFLDVEQLKKAYKELERAFSTKCNELKKLREESEQDREDEEIEEKDGKVQAQIEIINEANEPNTATNTIEPIEHTETIIAVDTDEPTIEEVGADIPTTQADSIIKLEPIPLEDGEVIGFESAADTDSADRLTKQIELEPDEPLCADSKEEFFGQFPSALAFKDELNLNAADNIEEHIKAYVELLLRHLSFQKARFESNEFRTKIVDEYLKGLEELKPPTLISKGKGTLTLTPVKQAKTIYEAGLIAKSMLK